jgi:hypothetical protein
VGEDNADLPKSEEEVEAAFQGFLKMRGMSVETIPQEMIPMAKGMFSAKPYIEGAWMDKFNGKYYLQYACPGAQYNTYADGVYVSEHPLGPFVPAENNPYSYKPGGFLPGAGHGSTMRDMSGKLWHAATMRISVNHMFERRLGIWPAGLDAEGNLFCNQRYGDWPMDMSDESRDPWAEPKWYLLSYKKPATASGSTEGKEAELAVNENVQNWWQASSSKSGEWLQIDLEKPQNVHAVQINFADDKIDIPVPGEIRGTAQARYIEEAQLYTRWILEGSLDGEHYFVIRDKSKAETDLTHDLVVCEEGMQIRFLKLTIVEVPYGQKPCISGLRVFGIGTGGEKPGTPEFTAVRKNDLDMLVEAKSEGAVGYNILWGTEPDKLYHSYMTFETKQRVGALVAGCSYYVRVDAFNECGITEGRTVFLDKK